MKIYIVTLQDWDLVYLLGVFSTLEKAEQIQKNNTGSSIQECELDEIRIDWYVL